MEYLSQQIGVSTVTIRKDLAILEEKGSILRTYGGAMRIQRLQQEQPYESKKLYMMSEKVSIAAEAAKLVKDGMTILIDAGSTTTALCQSLSSRQNLTVLTYNLECAFLLCNYPHISVIFIGGQVSSKSKSCTGTEVAYSLERYYVDISFIGCDGFSIDHGVLTTSFERSRIKQLAMTNATYKVLLTTSDKYQKKSLIHFASLEDFDQIYLDNKNDVLNSDLRRTDLSYSLITPRKE